MSQLKGGSVSIFPQDIFTYGTSQGIDLGAEATSGDGRRFRYVSNGAGLQVVAELYCTSAEVTTWEDLDIAAAAAGDTKIVTTSTLTATLNQLAGGYVVVTNGTGVGQYYKIKGNTAASSAVCTIYLEDPIALTTASTVDVDIILSPYSGVIVYPGTTPTGAVVGVSVYPIPATTATVTYYGWLQVGGPCAVLADAAGLTIGQTAIASDDTAGAIGPFETDAATYPQIGQAITAISASEVGMVMLNIN